MIYHDAVKIIIRIQGCFTTNAIYRNKNIFYTWFSLLPLTGNNFLISFELYQQHPQVQISTICSRQFRHTQSCPRTLYLPPPSAWFQSHTCILSIKVAISLFGIKIVFCCCLINYWNCNTWKHYTVIISLIESLLSIPSTAESSAHRSSTEGHAFPLWSHFSLTSNEFLVSQPVKQRLSQGHRFMGVIFSHHYYILLVKSMSQFLPY